MRARQDSGVIEMRRKRNMLTGECSQSAHHEQSHASLLGHGSGVSKTLRREEKSKFAANFEQEMLLFQLVLGPVKVPTTESTQKYFGCFSLASTSRTI